MSRVHNGIVVFELPLDGLFVILIDIKLLICYTIISILILHSALLISDFGIYFSNPRGTYIEQAIPSEPKKKTSENGTLIYGSESP